MVTERNIEAVLDNSQASYGSRFDLSFPPQGFFDSSGVPIASGTSPDLATASGATTFDVAKFDASDANTVLMERQFPLDLAFAEWANDLIVYVCARAYGSGAIGTTALQADLDWHTPGWAVNAPDGSYSSSSSSSGDAAASGLTTPATAQIGAAASAAAISGFRIYTLDVGARIRAESALLQAGDTAKLTINFSATIPANITIEVAWVKIAFRKHSAFADRKRRGSFVKP